MLIVGLTGGIATGKSTVSERLREHYNFPIVDADVIAREAVNPGTRAYNEIVDYFGGVTPHLIADDGSGELNRAALGRTIFGNEEYRKKLNSIVHPAVQKAMAWATVKLWLLGYRVCILDVPLLFEGKLETYVGLSVAVLCSESVQLERLKARNQDLTDEDARNRIASQMPLAAKRERADVVVENNGTLEDLNAQIDGLVSAYISPSWWLTVLQWILPIGAVWAYVTYRRRAKRLAADTKDR